MKKLIVLANLGCIRCVRLRKGGDTPQEKAHLVEMEGGWIDEPVENRGDVVTDQSGRFSRNVPAGTEGGMSYGEDHNLDSELERKALKGIADKITGIVAGEGHPAWTLVAPQVILPRLTESLSADCRGALTESLGADLTGEPLAKLEERFVAAG